MRVDGARHAASANHAFRVSIDLALTTRVVDLAAEGFDLAIRGGPVRDPSLVARRLRTEDAGLFASPSYLASLGHPRRVGDWATHDCVVYQPSAGHAIWTPASPRVRARRAGRGSP
jgi:DNA-binding transcriptional LysR family regulator